MQSDQFPSKKEIEVAKGVSDGTLDGLTIFRFAHMFKNPNAGGVEAYLDSLNRGLLERNRMQILQMYLTPDSGPFGVEIEQLGRGELIWIPSLFMSNSEHQIKRTHRLWARLTRRHRTQFLICHNILLSTLASYQPRLAIFHWISEDSRIVLNYLNSRQIPFVVVNHFQNTRLKRRLIRGQISRARAIGGVSNIDVPGFVKNKFIKLSDGVDTDFFNMEKATHLERKLDEPLIFLPSRITEEKGHLDAVRVLGCLARAGISAVLAFAGRQESKAFMEKLRRVISQERVQKRVVFSGELGLEELRSWYAASDIVVLPSYNEGLGRVLLEAQSMNKAVVTYDVGGVAEAIRNGETGFIVRKGDIRGLSRKILYLIENEERRRDMGKRGRAFVIDRFSLRSLVIRHERFYKGALAAS